MHVRAIAAFTLLLASWLIWTEPAFNQDKIGGKSLDEWIKDLGDPDPSTRQAAIRMVVHFGPGATKALPALGKALTSGDASVRGDAAAALGMIPWTVDDIPKVGSALSGLLQDTQRGVRIQAASSLGALGPLAVSPKETFRYLSFMITDNTSWEVRKTAAYTLGRLGLDSQKGPDPTAMSALTGALRDPCAAVRLEAIMALSELGLSPRPLEVNEEKKALTFLQKDRDTTVAVWATVLLIFLDEKLANNANINLLVTALGDPEPRVRGQAIRGLGALGRIASDGKAKIPNLLTTVPQILSGLHATDADTILFTLNILPPLGDGALPAVPQVAKLMKDRDLVVRCGAIRTMGMLGLLAKEYIPALISLLDDPDEQVVISAVAALGQLGDLGNAAIPSLKKLTVVKEDPKIARKDPARTPLIKQEAEQAIKQIETARPKK